MIFFHGLARAHIWKVASEGCFVAENEEICKWGGKWQEAIIQRGDNKRKDEEKIKAIITEYLIESF